MCEVFDPCPLPLPLPRRQRHTSPRITLLLSLKRGRGGTPRGSGDDHRGRGGQWIEARTRDRLGHRSREELNVAEEARPRTHVRDRLCTESITVR